MHVAAPTVGPAPGPEQPAIASLHILQLTVEAMQAYVNIDMDGRADFLRKTAGKKAHVRDAEAFDLSYTRPPAVSAEDHLAFIVELGFVVRDCAFVVSHPSVSIKGHEAVVWLINGALRTMPGEHFPREVINRWSWRYAHREQRWLWHKFERFRGAELGLVGGGLVLGYQDSESIAKWCAEALGSAGSVGSVEPSTLENRTTL
jgi:hypothetical protein